MRGSLLLAFCLLCVAIAYSQPDSDSNFRSRSGSWSSKPTLKIVDGKPVWKINWNWVPRRSWSVATEVQQYDEDDFEDDEESEYDEDE